MNSEEILKLAKECGISLGGHPMNPLSVYPVELKAFYKAAYNKGIEAAAKRCEYLYDMQMAITIRSFEELK